MNILLAPDAFKDSLTAQQVAHAMELGVHQFSKKACCYQLFASDGGEGFLRAIKGYLPDLVEIKMNTQDPLGRAIKASFLYDAKKKTAYIELARASGIELLSAKERNPLLTSTWGTGVQIKRAINEGARQVYVGLGGSATNDGGIGMAGAMGYRFIDAKGMELSPLGSSLNEIAEIKVPQKVWEHVEIYAVNDVLNPLYGVEGAAYTYGPQKGANSEDIEKLDSGLQNLARQVVQFSGIDEAFTPGSGAAGGSAYGLKCFFNAQYIGGTSFILNLSNFHELVTNRNIKLIITGEGKIDHQTAHGKFVYGLIQEASKYQIPVMAICGKLNLNQEEITQLGLVGAAELYDSTKSASYSFDYAKELIALKTKQLLESISYRLSIR